MPPVAQDNIPHDIAAVRIALLAWYDRAARTLAWRAGPGSDADVDPYRVWLSEVMLQQTTVPHATPYFLSFTQRWPAVADLAAAADADVMAAWAGLGYYARARNLLACTRAVANKHGGVFPRTEAELLTLPGVGAYTAAAVAAIAFGQATNVVDGNVERVMARLFAVRTPLPRARTELKSLAGRFVSDDRPGDWAQALMDLGATVCRPRSPRCDDCPVSLFCAARAQGDPELYPVKAAKAARPRRSGIVWILLDPTGQVAVVTRPDRGLLGGMIGLPTSDWLAEGDSTPVAANPPAQADWQDAGAIDHIFTHFSLTLAVQVARVEKAAITGVEWMSLDGAEKALPTVFAKALRQRAVVQADPR